EIRSGWWLLAIGGLEVLRQIHYVISEHWSRYHRFWSTRFFGGVERRKERMKDWTRFRLSRVIRWTLILIVLSLILSKVFNAPPFVALFEAPAKVVAALPLVLQFSVLFFVI